MTLKRGQAALEFLMTYGWAFLVMIAVIAGIVALDPLGAAQQTITSCAINQPLNCNTDTVILDSSNGLSFQLENVDVDAITVSSVNISGSGGTETCSIDGDSTLSPDETTDITCSSPNGTLQGSSASIVSGDQYTFNAEINYYTAQLGSQYTQFTEGQVRASAQ